MIDVVIVESHHHVLEHIHSAIRKQPHLRRRILHNNETWSMIHFDAHADLACPGSHIPAIACYRPHMSVVQSQQQCTDKRTKTCEVNMLSKENVTSDGDDNDDDKNLYDLLDSTSSGISEWILPLVLAANLRHIRWIRSSQQQKQQAYAASHIVQLIPTGTHKYHVGAYDDTISAKDDENDSATVTVKSFLDLPITATVKVDWDCIYYVEDNSYVPTSALLLPVPLHLTVVDRPVPLHLTVVDRPKQSPQMIASLIATSPTHVTTNTNASTLNINSNEIKSHDHCNNSCNNAMNGDDDDKMIYMIDICLDYFLCYNPFIRDIEILNYQFAQSLQDAITNCNLYTGKRNYMNEHPTTASEQQQLVISFRNQLTILLKYLFDMTDTSRNSQAPSISLSTSIIDSFLQYYEDESTVINFVAKMNESLQCHDGNVRELVEMAIESIPFLTMPHDTAIDDMNATSESKNEANVLTMTMIQEKLEYMRKEIIHFRYDYTRLNENQCETNRSCNPFMITIARSVDDGFTPIDFVDMVQDMVIQELHSIFCNSRNEEECCTTSTTGEYIDSRCSNVQLYGMGYASIMKSKVCCTCTSNCCSLSIVC